MTVTLNGADIAYPSGAHEFTLCNVSLLCSYLFIFWGPFSSGC